MRTAPRILLFGIYGLGLEVLRRLIQEEYPVVALVTKPETEQDRQPVGELACAHAIPVMQPERLEDPSLAKLLCGLRIDLTVVAGYHRRIPQMILDVPKLGTVNLHGSLLPKHRGPNPHKWAIVCGDTITGVTLHFVSANFDDGLIIAQHATPIFDYDTGGSLFDRLSRMSADLLMQVLPSLEARRVVGAPQESHESSYFSYTNEANSQIDWTLSAARIDRLVRGLLPRPGAWSAYDQKRIRILDAAPENAVFDRPGKIVSVAEDSLIVAAGTGGLRISQIVYTDPSGATHKAPFTDFLIGKSLG